VVIDLSRNAPRTLATGLATVVATAATALVTVLGAGLVTVIVTATPAAAGGAGDGGGSGGSGSTIPITESSGGCSMYANRSSFGFDCVAGSSQALSIREVLGGDPLPTCWHERLPATLAESYADAAAAKGEDGAFWLRICLEGIDSETLTGTARFTRSVVWLASAEPPVRLTERQRLLVVYQGGDGSLASVVVTRPVQPRVGQDVAFTVRPVDARLAAPTVVGPIGEPGGALRMRAGVIRLQVEPEPGRYVACEGAGLEVAPGDTRLTRPDACWWTFARSSAAQPGRRYPVRALATWRVEYEGGAAWLPLAAHIIGRDTTTQVPVSEIQTLVVP